MKALSAVHVPGIVFFIMKEEYKRSFVL